MFSDRVESYHSAIVITAPLLAEVCCRAGIPWTRTKCWPNWLKMQYQIDTAPCAPPYIIRYSLLHAYRYTGRQKRALYLGAPTRALLAPNTPYTCAGQTGDWTV